MMNSSRSVLVVDPDPDVLTLLSVILEGPKSSGEKALDKTGMRVLRARSVGEAMEVLGREYVPVDLVLSNFELSHDRGENIADRVREVRPRVPVLFMSAINDRQTVRIHGLKSDGSGMSPAICDHGLVRAVMAALDRPQATRAASSTH